MHAMFYGPKHLFQLSVVLRPFAHLMIST